MNVRPDMPPDLYAILGVGRDADADAIRAAYRAAAKTAHPDLGGSAEEFAAVKDAYDCLSDDVSRADYDRTGFYTRKPAETLDARALEKLRSTIVGVVNLIARMEDGKADPRPEARPSMLGDGSLIEALRWQLDKWLGEDRARLDDFKAEAAKYRTLVELFEGADGKPNRLSPLMQGAAKDYERQAAAVADEIRVKERALEILRDHRIRTPKAIGMGR